MLNTATVTKLQEMHLSAMAGAFQNQLKDPAFQGIFCSQYDVPGWRDKLASPLIADAVCDRIVHDSYRIVIDSTESMRKRNGIGA